MVRKKVAKKPKLYFTDEQIRAKLPPSAVLDCGKITYNGVPMDHRQAKVCIFNNEFFALSFPVKKTMSLILDKQETKRDPTERYLLTSSLSAIAEYNLAQPMLGLIAEGFYDEEVMGWSVYCSHCKYEGNYHRVALLYPSCAPAMGDHAEYVRPMMTHIRENRAPLDIQVDWVQD